MKKLKYAGLIAVSIMVFFACKKDTIEPTPQNKQTISKGTPKREYEKRWDITLNPNQRLETSSIPGIIAIEFVYNSYSIFFDDSTIITNSFYEIDSKTLNLKDYGTLTISYLNSNNFIFSILSSKGTIENVSAIPAPILISGTNTDILCNTWKVLSVKDSNGNPDTTNAIEAVGYHVTFSKYGSYYVYENKYLNIWKWADDNQNSLMYGEDYFKKEYSKYIAEIKYTDAKNITMIDNGAYYEMKLVDNYNPPAIDTTQNQIIKNARVDFIQ